MNPHAPAATSPVALVRSLLVHRQLTASLVRREVVGRYQGSLLGLLWSFFYPVLMLAVYTLVFGSIFRAKWPGGTNSQAEFALVLFCGLMMFNFFAECVNRAPTLVLNNANYVKKVVFPLEVLPVVMLGSAGFHLMVSLGVWLLFHLVVAGMPSWHALQVPFAVMPLALVTLGVSWLLAALGVYLRDVAQVVGVVTAVFMFLSPVFYPLSALPEGLRPFVELSPLSYTVEQSRQVMLWNQSIDWTKWLLHMAVSALVACAGYAVFQKVRKGFADVL